MTANVQWLARRLEQLEQRLSAPIQNMIEFTTLARTRADGFDQANVAGDDQGEKQRPVRRIAPWGMAGVPVVGVLSGLVKAVAGGFGGMVVGIATDKYGPQDLVEGEVAIYTKKVIKAFWGADDGHTEVNSDAGKTVNLNGDDQPVARKTDPVQISSPGALASWMSQVEIAINAISAGAVAPLSGTFIAAPGIAIKDGSSKVKAG